MSIMDTMVVIPAPPRPATNRPRIACSSDIAVPLYHCEQSFAGNARAPRVSNRQYTYDTAHPMLNRQYATRSGRLRPKASLVAPYYEHLAEVVKNALSVIPQATLYYSPSCTLSRAMARLPAYGNQTQLTGTLPQRARYLHSQGRHLETSVILSKILVSGEPRVPVKAKMNLAIGKETSTGSLSAW